MPRPEWQNINQGKLVGPGASEVDRGRRFDPAKGRPRYFTDSLWGFLLEPLADDKTRLVVSGYWFMEPRWLRPFMSFAVVEWTHWMMQTKQFANIKRRAERERHFPSPR
jgi:hypothetical protein